MKTMSHTRYRFAMKSTFAAAIALTLAACAAAPQQPAGIAEARAKLTALQSDPNLSSRAPVAVKEAEQAMVAAETKRDDKEEVLHLIYIADRKIDTAKARAETRFAEEERVRLGEQRDANRLKSRTMEADLANRKAAAAARAADAARADASTARSNAEALRIASMQEAEQLQRRIDELEAKPTDRGLVLTLGDVLFATGKADLNASATGSLNKLASFLNQYPERSAVIEGHTDSMGSDDFNQGLSQRRADSVKSYLTAQGIGTVRLAAAGKGESAPLADNDSAMGRQQNRRVEVIIDNPPAK